MQSDDTDIRVKEGRAMYPSQSRKGVRGSINKHRKALNEYTGGKTEK